VDEDDLADCFVLDNLMMRSRELQRAGMDFANHGSILATS
jgi:hypothetical protein